MRFVNTVLVFGAMGLFGSLWAAGADSGRVHGKEMGEKIAKELGLTADQKTRLKGLREEMRDARKNNFDKIKAMREKSREELLKASPDKSALYGYAREMGELHREMAEKETDHMLKVKGILTPDQFKKLLSKNMWQGKGRGGPHEEEGPGGPQDK